jgi:hypothetical protein
MAEMAKYPMRQTRNGVCRILAYRRESADKVFDFKELET